MKIVFDNTAMFADAMKWVSSVAGADGAVLMTISAASDVAFRSEGEPGMRRVTIPGHVERPQGKTDSIAISGPHISQMVRALDRKKAGKKDDSGVVMEIPDVGPIIISHGHLRFPVPRLVGPSSLQSDRERFSVIGEVDCGDFIGMLRSAQQLSGTQTGAVSMVDLTFDHKDMRISAMGTDKYVLGVFTTGFQPSSEYVKDCEEHGKPSRFLLVPAIGGMSLTGIGTIIVSESPDSMALDFGDGRLATMRKQSAEPLRWRLAIERQRPPSRIDSETIIPINVRDLLTSASIVTMGSGDANGSHVGKGIIILTAGHGMVSVKSGVQGSPTDSIATGYEGDDITLRFNMDELKRLLSVMPDEEMNFMTYGDAPVFVESDTMTVLINQSKGAE